MVDLVRPDINDSFGSTINKRYEEVYTFIEKKSRFILHLVPVTSEQEAEETIQYFNKKYHDASHNCYAYILQIDKPRSKRFSDDGEPKGTAGMPMLNVLEKHDMTNTLAVITRYFGGTLLGAGGLMRAYSKTLSEGLLEVDKAYYIDITEIELTIEYHDFGKLEGLLREYSLDDLKLTYEDKIKVCLYVMTKVSTDLIKRITDLTNANAKIDVKEAEICKIMI